METAEAPTGVETLPNASDMAPDNARAESGPPGAHDEEEDDDADGAADATQSTKTRKPRRPQMECWAEKVLKFEAAVASKQVRCRSMGVTGLSDSNRGLVNAGESRRVQERRRCELDHHEPGRACGRRNGPADTDGGEEGRRGEACAVAGKSFAESTS